MATTQNLLARWNDASVDLNTVVRGAIAAVVIVVSYKLTLGGADISKEWEAILLIVIGYYFKDRPVEESFSISSVSGASLRGLWIEILVQFVLALALIGFTIAAFLGRGDTSISGAWIGAVVLAVGFYFKEPRPEIQGLHSLFQTLIAAYVALLTLAFVSPLYKAAPTVPLQWVGIVLVVVAFYFKQRVIGQR